jgi:hypothetical protein
MRILAERRDLCATEQVQALSACVT